MIWLKLLGVFGWLKKAAGALLGLVRTYPLQCALIAAMCLAGWLWRGKQHAIADRDAARATIADMTAKAKAARQATVTIAKESDKAHEKRVTDNRSRTDRYIATRRLQPQACVSAPAEDQTTGPPEKPAAVSFVAMSEQDVKACGDLQAYAESAYQWGQSMVKAGLAD